MKKKILAVVLPILLIGLVVAGAVYYNVFSVELSVNQPITVTGNLAQTLSCVSGHTCIGTAITVSNADDQDRTITITNNNGNSNVEVNYVSKLVLEDKNPI
ncbi:unnamed protein product, partial [marine sediment metagenome]